MCFRSSSCRSSSRRSSSCRSSSCRSSSLRCRFLRGLLRRLCCFHYPLMWLCFRLWGCLVCLGCLCCLRLCHLLLMRRLCLRWALKIGLRLMLCWFSSLSLIFALKNYFFFFLNVPVILGNRFFLPVGGSLIHIRLVLALAIIFCIFWFIDKCFQQVFSLGLLSPFGKKNNFLMPFNFDIKFSLFFLRHEKYVFFIYYFCLGVYIKVFECKCLLTFFKSENKAYFISIHYFSV